MLTDFGNINAMNKSQIQTAIDYYNDKIAKMTKDESISAKTREWFLNRYNARVKSLNGTMQKLQNAINQAKLSGVLVNEQTASLDSFGLSASASNFSHLSQDQHKQKVKQRLKVLGACLLPVVGTIPFLVSLKRSKRRYKAVQSRLNQENIELDNFITSTKRPYEATLLSAEMFTDEQKQSLLQDPAEISRMETLLASGTISPIEKANLTKKLSNLREFAQQNGYNASVILTNPAFKTEADKTQDKTNKFQADYSAVASSGANLKEIYGAIKTLETLKTDTQALSNRNPKNTALKTLISDIDSKIAGLKAGATTLTKDGIAEIVNNISSVAVSSATLTVDEYNNAIAGVETASTSSSDKFGTGVSIENAKQMAEELGIVDPDKSPFDEIDKTKTTKLSGFTASRDTLQNESDTKTNITNNLIKLQNALDELKNIKPITKYNFEDAKDYLAEAESAYTYLFSVKGKLDSAQKTDFATKKKEYSKQIDRIKKAEARLNPPAAPAPGSPTP